MTTEYTVLLHGNEAVWVAMDAERAATIDRQHEDFTRACAERGHRITSGKELRRATTSTLVRIPEGQTRHVVTEGPYSETVEQLGGFYVIETEDPADLVELVAGLVFPGDGTVELRPVVRDEDRATTPA
ncbi:YciI family protein [Cellulomonas sp. NPDC055163]